MALCGSQNCGCAIQSTTLTVTGSGTGADPWSIELSEEIPTTTTVVTTGFTPATNWSLVDSYGYRIGNVVNLRVTCTRTTSAITVTGTGDHSAVAFATAPASLQGTNASHQALSMVVGGRVVGGSYFPTTGELFLNATAGTGNVAIADTISLGGTVIVS